MARVDRGEGERIGRHCPTLGTKGERGKAGNRCDTLSGCSGAKNDHPSAGG
jgi:hypothetical protein